MSQDTFLITGANGFLGSRIFEFLLKNDCNVIGCYLNKRNNIDSLKKYENFRIDKLDITSRKNVKEIFTKYKPNKLINCAAYGILPSNNDEYKILNTNLNGTLNLIKEANSQKVKRIIHFGSCFEYGSHEGKIKEEFQAQPSNFYGITKLACTNLLLHFNKTLNLPIVILRPFGVWGLNESEERLVPQILNACLNNKNLNLTIGDQIRDYTYVDDLVRWTLKILNLKNFPSGEIINLGSKSMKVKDFAKLIAREFQSEHLLKFGELSYRNNEMMELSSDNSKLINLIGKLEITSINEGLKKVLIERRN